MRRVAATFVPPITIERRGSSPMHRQIYEWFQGAVSSGTIRPGSRVPSTRSLATELGISRIPVVSAYEQLHAEGYFETSVGVGTQVARSIPDAAFKKAKRWLATVPRDDVSAGASRRQVSLRASGWQSIPRQPWLDTLRGFRVSLPALDSFPVNIWSKLIAHHSKTVSRTMLAYGDAKGYGPLREVVADYVRTVRGVRCEASQVLITTGSQQALQIASHALLNPRDRVCMEEPGYPGARQVFSMADAEIVPIGLDSEGLVVSDLASRGGRAKLVYVTPSHQYPMGMTMTASRRMQLLSWAAHNGKWIVEDDYDSEYRFDCKPIAALQGLDSDARVLYMGTFSKVMFPALRLGYLVLPKDLVKVCIAARDCLDIFSPTLNQAVMADFIREGHFGRHLRRMRMLYMERRKTLVGALQTILNGVVEVSGSEAGMHLVALLREGVDDLEVSRRAALNGLSVMPLSSCRIVPEGRGGLVLGYGGITPRSIPEGVRKLRECLEAEGSQGDHRRMKRK